MDNVWDQNRHRGMNRYQAFIRINSLKPRQNGHHFGDDVFKCIFLDENVWILIKISLKFVPKGPINNIPALVQIMAWRRPGDKPLSKPMMVSLLTHIYASLGPNELMTTQFNVLQQASITLKISQTSIPNLFGKEFCARSHFVAFWFLFSFLEPT